MGWKLKVLAFFIAFMLAAYGGPGGWLFAIPLFLYTFSGIIFRRRSPADDASPQRPGIRWRRRGSRVWVKGIGALFLVLALIAIAVKGTLAPYFFAILGLAMLLWGPLSNSSFSDSFRPVRDSILFRGTANPVAWAAVAEVKLLSHDFGRTLLALSERLLVVTSEKPSIYLVARAVAFSQKGAEEKILERLKEINKTIAPLGAYLLPMDGARVAFALGQRVEPSDSDTDHLQSILSSTSYDLVSVETEGGFVKRIGIYRKAGARNDGRIAFAAPRQSPSKPPLTSEVFKSVGVRVRWPNPDECTAFLTSMFATRYASQEARVTESGSSGSQTLLVKSLSTPPVELSRAQLSAIVKVYDK